MSPLLLLSIYLEAEEKQRDLGLKIETYVLEARATPFCFLSLSYSLRPSDEQAGIQGINTDDAWVYMDESLSRKQDSPSYYANVYTKKSQWEVPSTWKDLDEDERRITSLRGRVGANTVFFLNMYKSILAGSFDWQ